MPVNPAPLPRSKYLLNSFYIIIRWVMNKGYDMQVMLPTY